MPNPRRMTADELVAFAEGLARVAAAGGGAKALAEHLAAFAHADVSVDDLGRLSADADGVVAGTLELPLRLTAAAIAVEMARAPGGIAARRRSFWERLVARDHRDFAAARDDAAARGIALAPRYVAVALEVDVADEDSAAAAIAELRAIAARAFHEGPAGAAILERGAGVLILAPAQRDVDAGNARTAAELLPRTVSKNAPHVRFSGGVGLPASAVDVGNSAAQAETARAIGARVYGIGRTLSYDGLGAYALLFEGADPARFAAFASAALAPLRAYDEKHQTELERTLRLYFDVGQNVKTASAELHVHRQTVFYRLRQIGDICSRSFDDAHDQLTLRMALAIDALQR